MIASASRVSRLSQIVLVISMLAVACTSTTTTTTPTTTTSSTTTTTTPSSTEDRDVPAEDASPVAAEPTVVSPTPAPEPTPEPTATSEPTTTPTPPPTPEPTATPEPATASIDDALAVSQIESTPCPDDVAAAQVACWVATLPLDARNLESGSTVELLVAQVDNGDPQGIGPVVYLQGGPGVGSTTLAPGFVGGAHDAIFVDQRGTGFSTPKLDCPELDELWEARLSDDPAVRSVDAGRDVDEAFVQCHARLAADGVVFDHFNTDAVATDFSLIRQLLGYDEWAIWGISYGTRVGLTMMRDHPQGIRAAVLDSVVPFEIDFFATIPENGIRSMEVLGEACDATRCGEDHGAFFDNLVALTQRLDETPVVIEATRFGTGATFPFRVDGRQLIDIVFTQLYSTASLRSLPRQIARPDNGGLNELVASYMFRRDPNRVDLATGLYYTTWCREEFPFHDEAFDDAFLAEIEPLFGGSADYALSSDGLQQYCDIFEVPASDIRDDQPISSDIPTIVFAGAFDPITPPSWSRQAADALGNAIYVEMADHGHGMATACPWSLRVAFLVDPTADLDTSCAAEVTGPAFD